MPTQSALNSQLGRSENARFLEQFRYTVVASQLLNEHANTSYHNPLSTIQRPQPEIDRETLTYQAKISPAGLSITAALACVLAWSVGWLRRAVLADSSKRTLYVASAITLLALACLYVYLRRLWLQYVRSKVIESATALVADAQGFDAASSAALTLIQEVELVSRGYRMSVPFPVGWNIVLLGNRSSPLPPISRLEENSQTRRCGRLRRTLATSLQALLLSYARAHESIKHMAIEVDLEKYQDIYEISASDVQDVVDIIQIGNVEFEDSETLTALKLGLQRVHTARKLFFCSLLALDADGGKVDFQRWSTATDTMRALSTSSFKAALDLDSILSEEERFSMPPTPKQALTPGKERMRAQIRKLGSLSQGIRGLQAKLHVLREESDKTLLQADEIPEVGANLMAQYDSIGKDLGDLMQEWQNGKAALATNIGRHERKLSLQSHTANPPRSPTSSLGGLTAVSGDSPEALKGLSCEDQPSKATLDATSSDEEIFEATALPRQRSSLSREERIAKMKEERLRQAVSSEKTDASTHMLKELETVIRMRPRGRTTGRF